jgi:hypothetical protein
MKIVDDIIRKLSPARRRKVRARAAELIAEEKARAECAQLGKAEGRYKLADLIEQINPAPRLTEEDRQWLDAPAIGKEQTEE